MVPVPGQRIGPYEIRGSLGSGGMGLVFSAWDSRLHREVAIKLLRDEFVILDFRQRFLMEARAASSLNHPNICTVFDIGEHARSPFLVMELLTGQTLSGRLTSGPLTSTEVLTVGREVASALAAAHARSMIHRDIKPANIFLAEKSFGGWQAKVLDFGLAKVETLSDSLTPHLQTTTDGLAPGTMAYMSPEQARGEPLDTRSDLFALGVVLFEAATGRLPFEGATSALISARLLEHAPRPIRDFTPRFPRRLERVILKLLVKDRDARYQSAAEVLEDLQRIDLQRAGVDPLRWLVQEFKFEPLPAVEPTLITDPEWLLPIPMPLTSIGPGDRTTRRGLFSAPGKNVFADPQASLHASFSKTALLTSPAYDQRLPPLSELAFPPDERAPLRAALLGTAPGFEIQQSGQQVASASSTAHHLRSARWAVAAFCVIAVSIVALRSPARSTLSAQPHEILLTTAIVNETGDNTLNDVALQALRFDLDQSSRLGVLIPKPSDSNASSSMSLTEAATLARTTAATRFLYGSITRQANVYLLRVGIYRVRDRALQFQVRETASTREDLIPAIDRVSARIRLRLGESPDVVTRSSIPSSRESTASLAALHAFTTATTAQAADHPLVAIDALQQAVALDPHFTQAWLQLADLYREAHAEVAAADAATHARDSSAGTSDHTRLRAQASFELHATGDDPQALSIDDELASRFPLDAHVGAQRALLLRLQGRFDDALQTASAALDRDPADRAALHEMTDALLALDRKDAASQLEANRNLKPDVRLKLLLATLSPESRPLPDAPSDNLEAQMIRAQALDASGQLTSGRIAWQKAIDTASTNSALASATASMLAQAALNRALTSDCASALALARQAASSSPGPAALFHAGIVHGLCGDMAGTHEVVLTLMSRYPQAFTVKKFYLANLTALDQISAGDTDAALNTLQPAEPFDLISLTPLLRASARTTSAQRPAALADLQAIELHPGAAILFNPLLSAVAQLRIARMYASSGDRGDSSLAYRKFLLLWKSADPSHPWMVEANQHTAQKHVMAVHSTVSATSR